MAIHNSASRGFEAAGDSYEKGRPDFPQEALLFLARTLGISPGTLVLDLGAGTGKLTRGLLAFGPRITAVEPVEGMRKRFKTLSPDIEVLDGTAEAIPLEDASFEVAVVGQAFHWFDGPLALKEISRILKPGGKLGLIWNIRDETLDWAARFGAIHDSHKGDTPRYGTYAWKECFETTPSFGSLEHTAFSFTQKGNLETMLDRVRSVSFVAAMSPGEREALLEEVRELLRTHPQTRGKELFELPYRTDVYWCLKK